MPFRCVQRRLAKPLLQRPKDGGGRRRWTLRTRAVWLTPKADPYGGEHGRTRADSAASRGRINLGSKHASVRPRTPRADRTDLRPAPVCATMRATCQCFLIAMSY